MHQQSPKSTQVQAPAASRLFFALWPSDATRDAIYKASRAAVEAADGKPVSAANFHMTLVFLGSVAEDALPLVQSIAASVQGDSLRVELDRYGYWEHPQVLWCGASRVLPAAANLAASLRERLMAAGFRPDPKPFVPHVTLARKVRRPGALGAFGPVTWETSDFALVNSVTGIHGSEYTPLATYALGARRAVK
jgi:2'-5' RNA ligase